MQNPAEFWTTVAAGAGAAVISWATIGRVAWRYLMNKVVESLRRIEHQTTPDHGSAQTLADQVTEALGIAHQALEQVGDLAEKVQTLTDESRSRNLDE